VSLLNPGIEAFVAVVRHATVHGAAKDIGLTQTGVTQRIRGLERQLGTTLFSRSRKGMRLTAEGEALYRYCQRVQDMEGELLASLGGAPSAADLRVHITGPSSMMRCRVIPCATRVLGRFSNLCFTFHLDDDQSGLAYLKSGQSQLAVLQRHEVVDELDSKLLRPARYILVGPRRWQRRPVEDIVAAERIVDFNPADEATFRYLRRHGLFELARKERHLANSTDALAMLVAAGHGYSVLSEDFAAPLLRQRKLVDLNPGTDIEFEFALAWYPRHQMPAYFAELIGSVS